MTALLPELALEGLSLTGNAYSERWALLEELEIEGSRVKLVATFEDGDALYRACATAGSRALSRSASATRTALEGASG